MNEQTRKIVVTSCDDCPFFVDEGATWWKCVARSLRGRTIDEERGTPEWCPLRGGELVVSFEMKL